MRMPRGYAADAVPYMYALHVCLICMSHVYALYTFVCVCVCMSRCRN